MKKLVSLFAFVAISCAAFGAVLQTVKNVQPGEITVGGTGKLTSVDVFSPNANGTVTLDRIFSMTHFTNAVDTTTEILTNVVGRNVYSRWNYVSDSGEVFKYVGPTNEPVNHVLWKSDTTLLKYCSTEHYVGYDEGWNMTKIGESPITTKLDMAPSNATEIAFSVFGGPKLTMADPVLDHVEYSTNIVTVVTTNSVTPVKAYDLTITNQVLNGTCSGGAYHGVPSEGVWIFKGDKLSFGGTATGGAMRMVIE